MKQDVALIKCEFPFFIRGSPRRYCYSFFEILASRITSPLGKILGETSRHG